VPNADIRHFLDTSRVNAGAAALFPDPVAKLQQIDALPGIPIPLLSVITNGWATYQQSSTQQ
jgi:hypothetical protein